MIDEWAFWKAICGRSAWLAAALLVSATMAPVQAEDCRKATSQASLNECATKAFTKANGTLNSKYKAAIDRLSGDDDARKLLVAAQEAWLRYRDSECAFESSSSAGGSMHGMEVVECRTDLTDSRSNRLQQLLSCKEGDMACPLPPR